MRFQKCQAFLPGRIIGKFEEINDDCNMNVNNVYDSYWSKKNMVSNDDHQNYIIKQKIQSTFVMSSVTVEEQNKLKNKTKQIN